MSCIFCNLDYSKVENTIIEESNNFIVVPARGSLVEGYLLIISKRHIDSMSQLNDEEIDEYLKLIRKYRRIFKKIYGKSPIVFEHGSPVLDSSMSANSVRHAHTHIINHVYLNENKIKEEVRFKRINSLRNIQLNRNYIMYIDNSNKKYVSYNFPGISQLMRIYIAEDIGINDSDWKNKLFIDNINSTISSLRN